MTTAARRPDALFLADFRRHVGNSVRVNGLVFETCGCSLDSPDRDCDVGLALWNVATRNGKPASQAPILALMRR